MQGRKMEPGRYTFDPNSGRMGIFIGYCPDCTNKVCVPHSQWQLIDKKWHREQKKYAIRLFEHICKIRSL